MNDPTSNGSLYAKVLNRDGTVALGFVMLLSFFIYVYWSSLQAIQTSQDEQKIILTDIKNSEIEQTEILKDIRFSLRDREGISKLP